MIGGAAVGALMTNILGVIDLTAVNSVPELYHAICILKKEKFEECDRIVIQYGHTKTLELVKEILEFVDISEYFVTYVDTGHRTGLDFKLSDSHCVYPWIYQLIGNEGGLKPCCKFAEESANIKNTSIHNNYLGTYMRDLRQAFRQGQRPSQCDHCWTCESAGIPSMRQGGRYKFREHYYKIDYQQEDYTNLKSLDLSLGNNCNLRCNICNPSASSTMAKHLLAKGTLSPIEFNRIGQAVTWADSDEFWHQVVAMIDHLHYMDIYGGEPLMSKKHFVILEKLIALGAANNIKLDYNSNGTVYSEKFFNLWQHFKEVKISFSIDDIEHRFEQQRVGAVWSEVLSNLKKYNQHRSNKFTTEVIVTVNTQNVYWLPEILKWIAGQSFDSSTFNLLHSPDQYNIRSLDHKEKNKISDKLSAHTQHDIVRSVINLLKLPKG